MKVFSAEHIFRSLKLVEKRVYAFVIRRQRPNATVDFPSKNYGSANMTSNIDFCLSPELHLLKVLRPSSS